MKNLFYLSFIFSITLFITSCDKDEDNDHDHDHNHGDIVAPDTYSFERDGLSTVSYPGQTCRLEMAEDLYNAFKTPSYSEEEILTMFNDGVGFPVEYECGKNVGSKTSASSTASSVTGERIEGMISQVVNDVFPNWDTDASAGVAGKVTESDGTERRVNGDGMEIDQLFVKSLIGALCLDQITNNYLTATKLDGGSNDATGLEAGEYTDMEHYWDEGFGYLYGRDDQENPVLGLGVVLNKYLGKVNNTVAHAGIADVIYDAFKLGRAAIVAGDYVVRDQQSAIIKSNLDKVIAQKASDYLRGGADIISSGADRADAFHDLSEGYGFVLSLQFTDYFSTNDVNDMLDQLEAGNGFWDITSDELNSMASTIEAAAGM